MTQQVPVFDGHNDVLLRLYKSTSADSVADFLNGEQAGHIDLQKAKAGSLAGGLFALYSPSPAKTRLPDGQLSPTLPQRVKPTRPHAASCSPRTWSRS